MIKLRSYPAIVVERKAPLLSLFYILVIWDNERILFIHNYFLPRTFIHPLTLTLSLKSSDKHYALAGSQQFNQ